MSEKIIGELRDRDGRVAVKFYATDDRRLRADADIRRHSLGLLRALRVRYPNDPEAVTVERLRIILTNLSI